MAEKKLNWQNPVNLQPHLHFTWWFCQVAHMHVPRARQEGREHSWASIKQESHLVLALANTSSHCHGAETPHTVTSFLAFILPFPLNTVGRIFQSDIPSAFKNHNSIVHINSGRRCKDLFMCLSYKNKWKMFVRMDCDYLLWLWCGFATSQRQKFNNGLG